MEAAILVAESSINERSTHPGKTARFGVVSTPGMTDNSAYMIG
jgi:hypothetical protein